MISRNRCILIGITLCAAVAAGPAWARRPETGFLNRVVNEGEVAYDYQVFVPRNWTKNSRWPVILFLHGYGEEGDDGLVQTEEGIGAAIRNHVDRFPFVVVFPQCRKKDWWTNAPMEAQALKSLDQTIKEFKGDPQRIYLTGLSMGGYGTWDIASKHADRFAAMAPICGGIRVPPGHHLGDIHDVSDAPDPYAAVAQEIGKTPVWVFHGGADDTVPVAESRKMVEALKAAGGDVRYTEYEGVGHNSWDKAYDTTELFTWMLSHTLSQKQ